MQTDGSGVVAYFLHSLKADDLAVNVVTELLESLGNLDSVNRAEDSAGRRCLGTDGELNTFEGGCCGSASALMRSSLWAR